MVAQARLLVNSVNTALIIITIRMMTVGEAPTIKLKSSAIEFDKFDA